MVFIAASKYSSSKNKENSLLANTVYSHKLQDGMQLAWEQREAELERQLDQQEDENLSRAELVDYY